MDTAISLKKFGEKFKVVTYKAPQFLDIAHECHGTWREPAWWFDNIYIDEIRRVLLELWNVTGEEPYEECTLYIRKFSSSAHQGPVYLFNRLIAQSFGHGSKSKLGEDVEKIFGRFKVGGTIQYWTTEVIDMTMKIHRFPVPALVFADVQLAIEKQECIVIRKDGVRSRSIIEIDIEQCQFNLDTYRRELLIMDGMKTVTI